MKIKGSIIPKEKSLIALALRLKRRKCVETLQKQTLDVIFNTLNSHLLSRSLPTEEIFQVNGQNRRVAIPPVFEFPSQPRERLLPRPLRTQLLVFLPVFWFSSPTDFSFIKLTKWRERRVTCQQLIGHVKYTRKEHYFFSRVSLRLLSGLEILV